MNINFHKCLMERREEISREIRNLNDSNLPLKQKEERMLELDFEQELIEEQIELVENNREDLILESWR